MLSTSLLNLSKLFDGSRWGGEGYGLKKGSSYMYTIRVHQMPLMSTNIFFYLILKCSNGQDINMRQI